MGNQARIETQEVRGLDSKYNAAAAALELDEGDDDED